MPEITLAAETGRQTGSRPSGRLRTTGKIPAVVYGHGMDPVSVSIDRRALRAVLHTEAGHNALINLDVAGTSHLTIVKALQRHPVRNDVVHVDFIVVSRDEVVTVEVPIVLHGEAKAVAQAGGTVEQNLFSLTVQAKPGDIPSEISVDVSMLGVGDTIRVSDLKLPLGSATEVDGEEPVVIGQMSHTAEEVEAADEAVAEAAADAAEAAGETEGSEGGDEAAAESGDEGSSAE